MLSKFASPATTKNTAQNPRVGGGNRDVVVDSKHAGLVTVDGRNRPILENAANAHAGSDNKKRQFFVTPALVLRRGKGGQVIGHERISGDLIRVFFRLWDDDIQDRAFESLRKLYPGLLRENVRVLPVSGEISLAPESPNYTALYSAAFTKSFSFEESAQICAMDFTVASQVESFLKWLHYAHWNVTMRFSASSVVQDTISVSWESLFRAVGATDLDGVPKSPEVTVYRHEVSNLVDTAMENLSVNVTLRSATMPAHFKALRKMVVEAVLAKSKVVTVHRQNNLFKKSSFSENDLSPDRFESQLLRTVSVDNVTKKVSLTQGNDTSSSSRSSGDGGFDLFGIFKVGGRGSGESSQTSHSSLSLDEFSSELRKRGVDAQWTGVAWKVKSLDLHTLKADDKSLRGIIAETCGRISDKECVMVEKVTSPPLDTLVPPTPPPPPPPTPAPTPALGPAIGGSSMLCYSTWVDRPQSTNLKIDVGGHSDVPYTTGVGFVVRLAPPFPEAKISSVSWSCHSGSMRAVLCNFGAFRHSDNEVVICGNGVYVQRGDCASFVLHVNWQRGLDP